MSRLEASDIYLIRFPSFAQHTPTTLNRHSQRTNLVLCLILLVEECLQIDMASSDSMEDFDPAPRKVKKKSMDWTEEEVCRSS